MIGLTTTKLEQLARKACPCAKRVLMAYDITRDDWLLRIDYAKKFIMWRFGPQERKLSPNKILVMLKAAKSRSPTS